MDRAPVTADERSGRAHLWRDVREVALPHVLNDRLAPNGRRERGRTCGIVELRGSGREVSKNVAADRAEVVERLANHDPAREAAENGVRMRLRRRCPAVAAEHPVGR